MLPRLNRELDAYLDARLASSDFNETTDLSAWAKANYLKLKLINLIVYNGRTDDNVFFLTAVGIVKENETVTGFLKNRENFFFKALLAEVVKRAEGLEEMPTSTDEIARYFSLGRAVSAGSFKLFEPISEVQTKINLVAHESISKTKRMI